MKIFKKILASLTSAAFVAGAIFTFPVNSMAAVTLPDTDPNSTWPQYEVYANATSPFEQLGSESRIIRFDAFLYDGTKASLDDITVDTSAKKLTLSGLVTKGIDIDSSDWTIEFVGTNKILGRIMLDCESATISVAPNSTLSVATASLDDDGESAIWGNLNLSGDTVSSKSLTEKDGPYNNVLGPVIFSNKTSSTTDDPSSPSDPEVGSPEYYIANYNASTQNTANRINELAKSSKDPVTVEFAEGDALPLNIMNEIKASNNITLSFTFTYENVNYICKVTPAKAKLYVKDEIPWYGPLYLMQYFDVTKI